MIRVITDTTAGLPQEIIDEFNIPMVAQYVHFGEETVRDSFDMSPAEFYARQAAAAELPKTSAPSVGDFITLFTAILREDPTATLLCIHPSAEVSGTVRSAHPAALQIAAEFPEADIRIFDSRSISIGLGLMVWEACRMAREGASADAIMERMALMRDNTAVYFVVDTLEYLAKGGRIGRAAHLLGTLLDIKPILTLVDGTVESFAKARTRGRSIAAMQALVIDGVREQGGSGSLRLGVAHAICEDEARSLADALCAALNPEIFLLAELGPSIGVHAGPRTLAVCWVRVPGVLPETLQPW